ncbi:MAG: hypothetical protein JW885_05140 [Deltaproteobacteria bacterium]|nr:hypothetical protein [Candidatus Zymogenaceae bacterium]
MSCVNVLLWLTLIIVAVFFIKVSLIPRIPLIGKSTESKVYVALGYHMNLYHSYRIDTNDEAGFGKDIRIIRHIIDVMDAHNKAGSNVSGVWDIENLFTLEETLPEYAPDIIEDIKRRVEEGRDEIILMSYNNGLPSAMTEKEFLDSVNRAITNPSGSGVRDIFGMYSPIVRPQEMMSSPGEFQRYRDLGVNTICLYYSAIPFDALRVFLDPLTSEEAHNPLLYKNDDTGEEIIVIPTYNHGDMAENVSITKWARDLHRLQLRGKIRGDVLIFINLDADDEYWYGYDFPPYLSWLPNTGGIEQIIEEVDALEYAEFTTLQEYLDTHEPVGEISFGQDTADGNFSGLSSWSEKHNSHTHYTAVVKDRRYHEGVEAVYDLLGQGNIPPQTKTLLSHSYELRLRLLSTTNFGLAAPLLAKNRENVAENIIEDMLSLSGEAWESAKALLVDRLTSAPVPEPSVEGLTFVDGFMLLSDEHNPAARRYMLLRFDISGLNLTPEAFYIVDEGGNVEPTRLLDTTENSNGTAGEAVVMVTGLSMNTPYFLFVGPKGLIPVEKPSTTAGKTVLKNDSITIEISKDGIIEAVFLDDIKRLDRYSLTPRLSYLKEDRELSLRPGRLTATVENDGTDGVARVNLSGDFNLPEVKGSESGYINYTLTVIDGLPYVFLEGEIFYPETPREDLMGGPNTPMLLRKLDSGWYETAPAELFLTSTATEASPFKIIKRNLLGVDAGYELDYFKHSNKNLNLANVNNHITGSYVAAAGDNGGVAVAMDTSILADFAFCPMKMTYDEDLKTFTLSMNPFGAYFGDQYYYPTWGDQAGFEVALLSGQQYKSPAPTYNGKRSSFSLMVAFFDGDVLPEDVQSDMIAFSAPPIIVTGGRMIPIQSDSYVEKSAAPTGLVSGSDGKVDYIMWEKAPGNPVSYKVYLGSESGVRDEVFETDETTVVLDDLTAGKTYYTSVASVYADGMEKGPTEEISFVSKAAVEGGGMRLPISLQLKVLINGLLALID